MPLILYPDVPRVAGVPDVNREAYVPTGDVDDINVRADGTDGDLYADDSGLQWAVLHEDGSIAVEPDSVVVIDYRNEQRLVSHPVEQGSFSDINKVSTPFDLRLRMTCNGQGQLDREAFLGALQSLLDGVELVTIVTPDAVYESANLTHIDYRRESRSGVQLLSCDCWFEEVRQAGVTKTTNTAEPSGAETVSTGPVNPAPPSAETQAALAAAGVR